MNEPMIPESKKPNTIVRMLPGIVVSAASLAILFWKIDLAATYEAIRGLDWRLLVGAIVVLIAAVWMRGIAWRVILQGKVGVVKAFFTENEGYLLNNLLPFRMGEIGRALLMSMTTPMSFWEVFSTILVERIFDMGIMAGLLLATIPFIAGTSWAVGAAAVSGALVVLGFGILYLAARAPEKVLGLYDRLTRRWPRLQQFGKQKLALMIEGLTVLRDPLRFLQAFGLILLTWTLMISWNVVLLLGFIPFPGVLEVVFVVAASTLGVAAPSTPGYLGVYQAAVVGALSFLDVALPTALAYALASNVVYIVVTVLLGAIGLGRDGVSLREIYQATQQRDWERT